MCATAERDYLNGIRRCRPVRSFVDLMIPRVHTHFVTLVFLFAFCQVIGAMCALPDLSMAEDHPAILVEGGMACPMDGTIMCPPSVTSSPERQVKNGLTLDVDHAPALLVSAAVLTTPSVPTLRPWSNACSIVPISIASSSVLRI